MAVTGAITTFYVDNTGVDLGRQLVEKDYLLTVYPELIPNFRNAGLYVWGNNTNGSLGTNDRTKLSSPTEIYSGGTNWKNVSGGEEFGIGVKTDGTLWTWGRNNRGQLGDNTVLSKSSPIQTTSYGTNWKTSACSFDSSHAIKTDGTLWSWGYNIYGQLGLNDTTSRSTPVQVGTDTNWLDIAAGQYHVVATKTNGTLWAWGLNTNGQLGDSTTTSKSSPIQVGTLDTWGQISCGQSHTASIRTDGTLWTWGRNFLGQLGNGLTVNQSSPIQIGSEKTWDYVSGGYELTSAIKKDGKLWAWGNNSFGQLGTSVLVLTHTSSPVQVLPDTINWKKVSTGKNFCSAIKTNGTLWSWGANTNGELGTNDITSRSSPAQTASNDQTWKTLGKINAMCDSNYVIRDFDL